MSRSLPSFLGPQQFVGALFGLASTGHFAVWASRAGNPLRASLQRGDAPGALGATANYLSSHPAYALLFVVGVAVVARASLD